ncbi:MAG: DUF6498-containing protein [Bacteroidota bacterium]
MLKKAFTNPSILFLLAGNIYCIWYYENNSAAFSTVVWIYWFQSITIGLFNFLELLTIKDETLTTDRAHTKPGSALLSNWSAWFFLFHFGIFHLVYCVFLMIDFGVRSINKTILLTGISAFFLECVINFIRHKRRERTTTVNFGVLFFLPYLRVIPMHLMIILPAFFGWKPSLLFLVLKTFMDILSFSLYHHIYGKSKIRDTEATSPVM